MDQRRPSERFFRWWDTVRQRPVGRAIRFVRRVFDVFLLAFWHLQTRVSSRAPATFNQKLQHKMLHDRRPILTLFADKVAVRAYVAATAGDAYLTRAHLVADDAHTIDWEGLPREFVCKVSHASGGAIIVTEGADRTKRLPDYTPSGFARLLVHPDAFDPMRATHLLQRWLSTPYGWSGMKREWAYRDVPPRVLIEELLRGSDGGIPIDYKFYVFHGRCKFIEVARERFSHHMSDLYTREWSYLQVDFEQERTNDPQPRPQRLDEMLEIAERLAGSIDFVRVDLYALDDRVVFGEMTNYPASGKGPFDPPAFDRTIGDWWHLPPFAELRGR